MELEVTTEIKETFEFKIKWNVPKIIFDTLMEHGASRQSPVFRTKFFNSKWYVKIVETDLYVVSVHLEKADIEIKFTISGFYQCGNGKLNLKNYYTDPSSKIYIEKGSQRSFIQSNGGTLSIILNVNAVALEENILNSKPDNENIPAINDTETLQKNYEDLAMSGQYSDITLIVGEKKFKAHKSILAFRSQYFEKMLGTNFKESTENEVKIKDIEPEDFDYLLKFIYSGKRLEKPTGNVPRLLKAADLLGLTPLVLDCANYLVQNITLDNCLELFQVADMHSCDNLKVKVKEFISDHTEEVMKSEAWETFKKENSRLLVELFQLIHLK